MTHPASKAGLTAGAVLLGGLAVLALFARAGANSTAVAQGANPRFVYASGFQGVGYYANTGARAAGRGRSVGPGVRDWSTGQRGRLHKPWLSPR